MKEIKETLQRLITEMISDAKANEKGEWREIVLTKLKPGSHEQ